MTQETLLIIDAPHFYAGAIVRAGHVCCAAPILRWTEGRSVDWVLAYVRRKGWKVVGTDSPSIPAHGQHRG